MEAYRPLSQVKRPRAAAGLTCNIDIKASGPDGTDAGKLRPERFVGNGLLLHTVAHALPSALADLTAGFEMDPGVPPPL